MKSWFQWLPQFVLGLALIKICVLLQLYLKGLLFLNFHNKDVIYTSFFSSVCPLFCVFGVLRSIVGPSAWA